MASDLSPDEARSVDLVERISLRDDHGVEELYAILSNGVRGILVRAVGIQSAEDVIHEVFVTVLEAIYGGELRDPRCLMGFLHRVARRRAVAHIRQAIVLRRRLPSSHGFDPPAPRRDSPDNGMSRTDRLDRARRAMRRLSRRDREILVRFYLHEQSRAQICGEMRLTDTQFRLFKSRAIARCTRYCQIGV